VLLLFVLFLKAIIKGVLNQHILVSHYKSTSVVLMYKATTAGWKQPTFQHGWFQTYRCQHDALDARTKLTNRKRGAINA